VTATKNLEALLTVQQTVLEMFDGTPELRDQLQYLATLATSAIAKVSDADVSRVLGFVQGALWALREGK
jgi:hypothetical protein